MALVNQYGRPYAAASPGSTFYRGAARDTQSLWDHHRPEGIETLLPAWDRTTLLTGSRGMYANFGPCRAAIFQKANAAVGQSYLPDFTGTNSTWGQAAREYLIGTFYPIADVRGAPFHFRQNLWLDSVALDRDGDFLVLLTSHAESGLAATQHISAHRCRTGPHDQDGESIKMGPYRGAKICDGVIKDRNGRAIAHRIHTGDDYEEAPADFEDISSRHLRHSYDPEWHDQGRGIPGGAHAIRMLRQSLQSHEWEHVALMMLSSIGLIERNPLGAADPDDPNNSIGSTATAATGDPGINTQTMEGGMIRYFYSGDPNSGIESIKGERPSEQWDRFQDRTIRLYSGGIWPYELIWKSDSVNGVTIRNIQARATQIAKARQAVLDGIALGQVTYALFTAVAQRLIPAPDDLADLRSWSFRRPAQISIDPGRDTSSEIAGIESERFTLQDVVEADGGTIEEHYQKIANARNARTAILGDEADHASLKEGFDSYGVGVRAGALTPTPDDEAYFRQSAGLPAPTPEVSQHWDKQGRVRQPITILPPPGESRPAPNQTPAPDEDPEA